MSQPPINSSERLNRELIHNEEQQNLQGSRLDPPLNQNRQDRPPFTKYVLEQMRPGNPKCRTYYCPCYMRMKIKHINSVNVSAFEGSVKATLLFTVYYGAIHEQYIETLFKENGKSIKLSSNHMPSIELKSSLSVSVNHDQANKRIDYVVRDVFTAHLSGSVRLSPFQIINLNLSLRVHTLKFYGQPQNVFIKFNLMDLDPNQGTKMDWSDESAHGNYELASRYVRSYFTNRQRPPDVQIKRGIQRCCDGTQLDFQQETMRNEQDVDEEGQVQNFGYAHFYIPIFRHPTCNLLVNMMLLGVFNLAFFFPDIRGNIGSLSLLTLGYVNLIPIIRSSIPQTPLVLMMEVMLYVSIFAMMLTLAQILIDARHQFDKEQFVWYRQPLFWVVAAINLAIVIVVVSLFICHRCCWAEGYVSQNKIRRRKYLEMQHWENKECDQYFNRFRERRNIRRLQQPER